MATLTPQEINHTGVFTTYAAAAGGGDQFSNDGRHFVFIKNGHSSPQSVIANSQSLCDQGADHDITVVVTNAEDEMFGPFPPSRFNDGSGFVQLTYTGVVSLTIAIMHLVANP